MLKKLLVIILICIGVVFYFYSEKNSRSIVNSKGEAPPVDTCGIRQVNKEVRGDSMAPAIKAGQTLGLLENYYYCHPVERGDVVAVDYSRHEAPLVKRVKVLGGDRAEFTGNNLLVNGEILRNSEGDNYVFSGKQIKLISIYIKNGRLRADGFLIFGERTNNGLDSRAFGAVGKKSLLGKFEL
jgi:signal peptidase I